MALGTTDTFTFFMSPSLLVTRFSASQFLHLIATCTSKVKKSPTQRLLQVTSRRQFRSIGCNADLGCVHAAVSSHVLVTVVNPVSKSESVLSKYRQAGATQVILHGQSHAEAACYTAKTLIPEAREDGKIAVHVHSFDSPRNWDGIATLVREVAAQFAYAQGSGGQMPCQSTRCNDL